MDFVENLTSLVKALEAGNYNAPPSTLVQGAALQTEDLSPVMRNVTFGQEHIKLQKMLDTESVKSMLSQYNRQLSYGMFGGSAQIEGFVGQEQTSDYVRAVVPMCFYSHTRRVTLASTMVQTVDGKKSDERAAEDAAILLAADIEFDLFRGKGDFSNAGVFDGNPLVIPSLPNMLGLEAQIRQSDAQRQAQDLMFAEFGSQDSVVIQGGGLVGTQTIGSANVLQQTNIEDASTRSAMNMGSADKLILDPKTLSAYNKVAFGKERIILANSGQDNSGADLRRQWVSGGVVTLEASRFLSGKTSPARPRSIGPSAPASVTGANVADATALAAGTYKYVVTQVNEVGEGPAAAPVSVTCAAADRVELTITGAGTVRYWNVYRSAVNGPVAGAKFIGRVANMGGATTKFWDLGNKIPGFVTGYLVQGDTMDIAELASYSRLKMAVADLSQTEAHFRFLTLRVQEPRKNVLVDNLGI